MDNGDKKRFAAAMKALATSAGVALPDADTMRLYFHTLSEFDIDQVEGAVVEVLQEWEYNRMPPVAAIHKKLRKKLRKKLPAIEDRALAVASHIVSHLQAHGAASPPDLSSDPIAAHLMSTRWPYQRWGRQLVESEVKWWVKEFCDAYRAYEAHDVIMRIEGPKKVLQLVEKIGG